MGTAMSGRSVRTAAPYDADASWRNPLLVKTVMCVAPMPILAAAAGCRRGASTDTTSAGSAVMVWSGGRPGNEGDCDSGGTLSGRCWFLSITEGELPG